MTGAELKEKFETAMRDIYARAADECNYRPTYFLRMVDELGGVETARTLLQKKQVSEGFTKLAMYGRLDLSVEALVLQSQWVSLFTPDELKVARRRLKS